MTKSSSITNSENIHCTNKTFTDVNKSSVYDEDIKW